MQFLIQGRGISRNLPGFPCPERKSLVFELPPRISCQQTNMAADGARDAMNSIASKAGTFFNRAKQVCALLSGSLLTI